MTPLNAGWWNRMKTKSEIMDDPGSIPVPSMLICDTVVPSLSWTRTLTYTIPSSRLMIRMEMSQIPYAPPMLAVNEKRLMKKAKTTRKIAVGRMK